VILIEVPALDPSLEQSIDLQFRILVCGGYPRVADPHRAKILSRHVLAKKVLAGGSGKVGGERCRRSAQYDAPLATKGRLRDTLVTAVQTAGMVRGLELAFRGLDGTALWAIIAARVLDHDGEPVLCDSRYSI
jgi:hypothetical protein